ncbi:hypothetical protein HDZ31DRAFT_33918 [Schizophyllum fasciatum]
MNPATSTSVVKKRKKPPACDYCKGRRVICHPQPNGKPCPRCVEKGVVCTTTPVVRRKSKRHVEDGDDLATPATPSTSTASPFRAAQTEPTDNDETPASISAQSLSPAPEAVLTWRDAHPLPATLVEELIKLFPSLPQSQMPIVPFRRIYNQLEACGWDPHQLQPHACVLAYCIMAVTARVSTHPMLIGADVTDTQLVQFLASGNVMITPGLDLREFGRRRDAFCRRLHDEAGRLAVEAGVTVMTSEETAASCYLLDFLESSTNPYEETMTWTAAMMWHIRTLAESGARNELFSDNHRHLHWPLQLMHSAVLALCSGRSIPFTEHDERLICGPPPEDIETATMTLASQPVTGSSMVAFIYSFTSHVIHLARQSSEKIIGPYARRFPLDEATLFAHIKAIEALQKTCVFLHDCIDLAIPKAARESMRPALAKGLCVTGLAAPGLLVPLHRELKRRLELGSVGVLQGGADSGTGDGFVDRARCRRSRVESMYRRVRSMAVHATVELQKRGPQLPSLAYMTHIQCTRFAAWTQLFVNDCEPLDMTPLERYVTLERIGALMKLDGFSWIDRFGSLSWIDNELAHLQCQYQLVPHLPLNNVWGDVMARGGMQNALSSSDSTFLQPERGDTYDHGSPAWSLESTQSGARILPYFPAMEAGPSSVLEHAHNASYPSDILPNFDLIQ